MIIKDFLKEVISWQQFELLIDSKIFSTDIVLKAAYNFLDRWYFFFYVDKNKDTILQFTPKEGQKVAPKALILEFSDSLLDTHLRNSLEKENKKIREAIITKALAWPIDSKNFISFDPSKELNQLQDNNKIDFDKDIDEILREIENDPDLKIDEAEIDRILKEIENEQVVIEKPTITLDTSSIASVKQMFKTKPKLQKPKPSKKPKK